MNYNFEDVAEPISGALPQQLEVIKKENFISAHFSEKGTIMKSLLNLQTSTDSQPIVSVMNEVQASSEFFSQGSDLTSFVKWKNVENISARLVEFYDNIVVLECLIDKDLGIYEEREFDSSYFEDYELKVGALFYLRTFRRKNEGMFHVHNDPKLINESDFPKVDFKSLFNDNKLFKKL